MANLVIEEYDSEMISAQLEQFGTYWLRVEFSQMLENLANETRKYAHDKYGEDRVKAAVLFLHNALKPEENAYGMAREIRSDDVLYVKKASCLESAAILNMVLQKLGYESFLVLGYTGKDKIAPHAWNLVEIAGGERVADAILNIYRKQDNTSPDGLKYIEQFHLLKR
ncbi:MAG: hypothetical protein ACP5T3_01275 [Candidatus Micrarchaeia archaeon]